MVLHQKSPKSLNVATEATCSGVAITMVSSRNIIWDGRMRGTFTYALAQL